MGFQIRQDCTAPALPRASSNVSLTLTYGDLSHKVPSADATNTRRQSLVEKVGSYVKPGDTANLAILPHGRMDNSSGFFLTGGRNHSTLAL